MNQEDAFYDGEGDVWFARNKDDLAAPTSHYWPLKLLKKVDAAFSAERVLDLGCTNGYRLESLRKVVGRQHVGVDASRDAIEDGKVRFNKLDLYHGRISDLPLKGEFDLVIVNFVFHWVDRALLSKTYAEVDRVVADNGLLIIGDFLPDTPHRVPYHHVPDRQIYTYKQNYPKAFEAIGTYREVGRLCYPTDSRLARAHLPDADRLAGCVALRKSLHGYYEERSLESPERPRSTEARRE